MFTYHYLRKKVKHLCNLIDAPEELLPNFKKQGQDGTPCVVIKFPFYYLITSENGLESDRKKFKSADMLLYAVFENITFDMASQYEVTHRISDQDSRRLIFSHQQELMGMLSKKWEDMLREKIDRILNVYPYNDDCYK